MSQPPAISRVLIVPGLPTAAGKSAQNVNFQSISIGLVIDNADAVWGEFQPTSAGVDWLTMLQDKVVTLLEGRPLTPLQALMDELDDLTETAVLTRPIPPPLPGSVSRRSFLTANLAAEPTTKYEDVLVERPLSAPLRYGLSQILLTALARTRNVPVAQQIATTYDQPWSPALIPLHLEIDMAQALPDAAVLMPPIQSLGYRIASSDPQAQLGANGEHLQRFIRQLTQLIGQVAEPDYRPTIHLDVAGGLGQLFDYDNGRILGTIYGLEQATKPFPLRITDPAQFETVAQQIEFNRELLDYLRLRGLKTEIAVRHSLQTLSDIEQFVAANAAHMIEIVPQQLGTVQQTIQAIQACRQAQTSVLLKDDMHPFASQLALAVRPDLITAFWEPGCQSIDKLYREMAKNITFFTQIRV